MKRNITVIFLSVFVVFTFSCKKNDFNKTIPSKKSIVVLGPADCEIVCALGAEDIICGVGEYCDYPDTLRTLPVLVSNYVLNTEMLLNLKPDLIIADALVQNPDMVKQMESFGFNVLVTSASDFSEVYEVIKQIGKAIDKEKEAEKLAFDMQSKIQSVNSKVSVSGEKSIYYEVSPLEYGLWTAGRNTFMNEIGEYLKLQNIFNDIEGWSAVSQESVIERNPDYIITIADYGKTYEESVNEIKNRAGWGNINAVKGNKVFYTSSNSISRPGPRLADAVINLYEQIYGN